MRQPKLLVILPAFVIGGAETVTHNLLKRLDRFECVLLTQADVVDFYAALPVKRYLFDDHHCLSPYELSRTNILRYARAIGAIARRERPDLVLAIMHNGTLFASVAKRLFLMDMPVVGTILGNISAYFAQIGRPPSWMERWIIRQCTHSPVGVIVPSQGVADDLIDGYGAAADRLKVIPNGMDLVEIQQAAQAPLPSSMEKNCPWMVSACRLNMQKDFRTLLLAAEMILRTRRIKLVVVGSGELRGYIEAEAVRLGIGDHVTLTGFQKNPFPYMANADVFVLSSFFEGFGNVIVEAMALGVPVVASDCPSGPREIIEDEKDGFLVPTGDWKAMAWRCQQLLGDEGLRRTIGEAGLVKAGTFEVGAMVSGFEEYLSEILGRGTEMRATGKRIGRVS